MLRHRLLPGLILLATLPAYAQDAAPADGWTGTGELGFAMSRGNARSENLNARLAFGKETAQWKHEWYAAALRAKGEVTGDFDGDGTDEERYELNANRYELGAASAYKFNDRSYVIGSGRYEHDEFSAYDYQATLSIGYGYRFVDNDRTHLSAEIGPGFRRARDAATGETENGAIGRARVNFSHKLTDNTELVDTLLVESGSDNTFAQNDLGLVVAMNEAFALKAGLQVRYNSDVDAAAGVKKTDTLTTINLVYNFR
jgi:putative salt-induced outer membrane protein